ncbi:MAG: DNA adenine methylase [Bacteroidia bacterium]|nr:DNA adenine methylase [Bacteroidia bacterium]MDW8302756.1 DNA adenine methylase [Bacteroidia bacterium]
MIKSNAVPSTQSIKYIGSKLKILPYILNIVQDIPFNAVLDGFSGSTRVSQAFAQLGFKVTANDIAVWSETLGKAYLLNQKNPKEYQELIDYLNSLKGYYGWFSEHYGGSQKEFAKKPFQLKNTMKLDAIRDAIDRLNLEEIEKAVALTSLMLALDAVDNTLGHFSAYLSKWSARSYKDLVLRVPQLFVNSCTNEVFRQDIFTLIEGRAFDLAYFDPPYGSNNEKMPPSRVRYSAYYHFWKTLILNDKPAIFGSAKRREDTRDEIAASVFEEFRKDESGHYIAMQAIHRLIAKTQANYILLSYSSGGRATRQELFDILCAEGKLLKMAEIDYKRNVMTYMRWTNQWTNDMSSHKEYLFLIKK